MTVQSWDALQRLPIRPKSHTRGAACGPLTIYLSLIMTNLFQGEISPYNLVVMD